MIALIPGYMAYDRGDFIRIVVTSGNVAHGPDGEPLVFGLDTDYETLLQAAKAHETYLAGLFENLSLLLGRDAPLGFTDAEDDERRAG